MQFSTSLRGFCYLRVSDPRNGAQAREGREGQRREGGVEKQAALLPSSRAENGSTMQ